MNFTIRSMDIEPESAYLEFIGPAKASSNSNPDGNTTCQALKGKVRLNVLRSVKIRSLVLKFKGYTRVSLHQSACSTRFELEVPFLPKVKLDLLSTMQKKKLAPGEHMLSWELNIPNVYPRSLMVKRASIFYKLELTLTASISGLTKKSLSSEYPIVLLRHLLPNKEISPVVGTRIYRQTIPAKFHYEIDCPRIVCLEQKKMPVSIRFLCIASQKPVQSIKTQILQIELYRCENIPKSETNLENLENGVLANSNVFGQRFADAMKNNPRCIKFTRRKGSTFVYSIHGNDVQPWQRPVLLYHELDELLTFGIESPLVTIYHQLEVTFQFGHKFENIRAKIPVMITSLPFVGDSNLLSSSGTSSNAVNANVLQSPTANEFLRYKIETAPHDLLSVTNTANDDRGDTKDKDMDPDIARQQSVFMGLRASTIGLSNRPPLRLSSSMVLDHSPPAQDHTTAAPPSPSLSAFGRSVSELNLNSRLASPAGLTENNSSSSSSSHSSNRSMNNISSSRSVVARLMNEPLPPRPGSLASSEALPEMDRYGERVRSAQPLPLPPPPLAEPLSPVQMNRIDPWLTNMLAREYTNDVGGDDGDNDTASDEALSVSGLSHSSATPSVSEGVLRSRPPSPIAPGLPPAIPLQPLPQSTSLFEEEFGGCTSPLSVGSSPRSLNSSYTVASSSVLPSSGPSIIGSYASSVQAHYHQAALPPLPPLPQLPSSPANTEDQRYFEDSDDDADGPVPSQLSRLSLGSVFKS